MAAHVPLPILAVRGSTGLKLFQGKNNFSELDVLFEDNENRTKVVGFSKDGSHFAFCNGERLKVLDMTTGSTVFDTEKKKTLEMVFSPKNTFLAVWEPYFTTPQNPQGFNNYEIFNIKNGEAVKSMILKRQQGWAPAWSCDEKICGRCVSNEVQFFEDGDLQKAATKLYLQGVAGFSIAPSAEPYMVAAHVTGKKGAPSFVRLFQYPNFAEGQAISNRSFFKADKVEMFWNKKGSALLILGSVEIDTTGSSYYGEQSLHFMSTRGDSSIVTFDKRGPIYCVEWNPNSSQFCVVYGYMPAKACLFNLQCEPIFDFGSGPRNLCMFNAHGNILCLAGFGNLSGFMEMWNVDGKKMISKPQARDATHFEWCPDGQHFVTSTCAPKLRVSNGYKIWHYSGKELHTFDALKNTELWEASWQSQPDGTFAVPRIVAGKVAEVKKEAYRPPSARGTTASKLVLHEVELPQNQRNQENLSAAALKNKKKREAKAKTKAEAQTQETHAAPQRAVPTPTSVSSKPMDPETEKEAKRIRKKLKAIEDLKAKQRAGNQLEKNQLDKIKSEKDLLKELEELELSGS